MRISSLLPFIPLLVSAQLSLPENALEGFGIHLSDDSGRTIYVHESEFESYGISVVAAGSYVNGTSSDADTTNSTSLTERGLPVGDAMYCDNSQSFWIEDLHSNMIQFSDYMLCNFEVSINPTDPFRFEAASYYLGTSVIYLCNYSGKSRVTGSYDMFRFLYQVFEHCGESNIGGWYYQGSTQMSWGYTSSTAGYCGPPQ
ncbi:hypothetical protein NQ176_g2313 [Zarea fungicola]|uniref:Uncharacterized protein n=1 Tax=Zarea fungicola TaxID=93591 RepID=A0ACC1NNS1_9HYPO|nr:hypothetical protein NQ176_g2313 [Lecanicillium fungicola]